MLRCRTCATRVPQRACRTCSLTPSLPTQFPPAPPRPPIPSPPRSRFYEVFPNPLVSRDRFARFQADVVLEDMAPTKRLADLGLEATSMEMPGFSFLHRFRQGMGGHFA